MKLSGSVVAGAKRAFEMKLGSTDLNSNAMHGEVENEGLIRQHGCTHPYSPSFASPF